MGTPWEQALGWPPSTNADPERPDRPASPAPMGPAVSQGRGNQGEGRTWLLGPLSAPVPVPPSVRPSSPEHPSPLSTRPQATQCEALLPFALELEHVSYSASRGPGPTGHAHACVTRSALWTLRHW